MKGLGSEICVKTLKQSVKFQNSRIVVKTLSWTVDFPSSSSVYRQQPVATGNECALSRQKDATSTLVDHILVLEVVLLLLFSVPLGFMCQLVGIPTLFGYILAGVVLGPSGINVMQEMVRAWRVAIDCSSQWALCGLSASNLAVGNENAISCVIQCVPERFWKIDCHLKAFPTWPPPPFFKQLWSSTQMHCNDVAAQMTGWFARCFYFLTDYRN